MKLLSSGLLAVSFTAVVTAAPVKVDVTGNALSLNGQTEIPKGLFGVHALPMSEEVVEDWGIEMNRIIHHAPNGKPTSPTGMQPHPKKNKRVGQPKGLSFVIDCYYDRYQPALILTRQDWKEHLQEIASKYAKATQSSPHAHFLEFWNEPYLNWASKPGVNYHEAHFDKSSAAPGAPMISKITGKPVEGLVWDKQVFMAGKGGGIDYVASRVFPRDGEEGQTVKLGYGAGEATLEEGAAIRLMGRDYTMKKQWMGKDPEQEFYWSGPVNLRLYNEMLTAFGEAYQAANPSAPLAAGWGFNFFNENWAVWERLIKPTIDENYQYIDAIHEHHYGGDTSRVAAAYEVAYAYTLGNYDKRLEFWNTEAGGHLDPEQPGNPRPNNQGDPETRARAAATYFLRDVAYLLARMPDKATMRAAHEPHHNGGDEMAFKLLKGLRGQIMQTESGSPNVWSAAALNGSELVVLLFNDKREKSTIDLHVNAPRGSSLMGYSEARIVTTGATPPLEIKQTTGTANGSSWTNQLELDGKAAAVVTFRLQGHPDPNTVALQQQVSAEILLSPKDGDISTIIPLPDFREIRSGKLRLVSEGLGPKPEIMLNGTPLETGEATNHVWDITIPPSILKPDNKLEIKTDRGRLLAASLLVEEK